jgi:hypothetical protein
VPARLVVTVLVVEPVRVKLSVSDRVSLTLLKP